MVVARIRPTPRSFRRSRTTLRGRPVAAAGPNHDTTSRNGLADKSPADPGAGRTVMRAITLRAGLALAVMAGLTAGRATAAAKVKDFGELFSADAVKKANAVIAEVARAGTDVE